MVPIDKIPWKLWRLKIKRVTLMMPPMKHVRTLQHQTGMDCIVNSILDGLTSLSFSLHESRSASSFLVCASSQAVSKGSAAPKMAPPRQKGPTLAGRCPPFTCTTDVTTYLALLSVHCLETPGERRSEGGGGGGGVWQYQFISIALQNAVGFGVLVQCS